MGKRSRTKARAGAPEADAVGPRQPCPCGSGKRFKACHGAGGAAPPFVVRTFEGLPDECDWVALREFVPSATAPLNVRGAQRDVLLCSLLPMAWPALVRADGATWVGLQVQHSSADVSRDVAYALERALESEPGETIAVNALPGQGNRLQDLVDQESLEITVHDGFEFWVDGAEDPTGHVTASLEQANAAATPSKRLTSVDAAYWCDVGAKEHLRWVMPHPEERLLSALARLHVGRGDSMGDGTRLVGSFRAHGLLVPVWDLPVGTGAAALEEPATGFAERLAETLADHSPLSAEERSARAGLANRQLTIR